MTLKQMRKDSLLKKRKKSMNCKLIRGIKLRKTSRQTGRNVYHWYKHIKDIVEKKDLYVSLLHASTTPFQGEITAKQRLNIDDIWEHNFQNRWVNFLQKYGANINHTWHKAPIGKGDLEGHACFQEEIIVTFNQPTCKVFALLIFFGATKCFSGEQ